MPNIPELKKKLNSNLSIGQAALTFCLRQATSFLSWLIIILEHDFPVPSAFGYEGFKSYLEKMFQQSKRHYLGKSHRQPVLFRESLQNVLSVFAEKKDFLTSEKPGKVAC